MIGLYYALGGGLGHGMRGLALARELARIRGGRHVVLVNTPFHETLRVVAARDAGVELRALSPEASPNEAGDWVARQRDELRPDLLVVDTFPRGLGGELAARLPSWRDSLNVLVSRTLPDDYVRRFGLVEFVRATFELVFAPGEASPFESESWPAMRTGPWLVRRADELLAPVEAAQRLGCAAHERCVLVVGSGTADECREWMGWFRALLSDWPRTAPPLRLALPLEIPTPDDLAAAVVVRHAPLVEVLPGVAAVLGNAGYHLTHETRWLGIPARLVARRRLYDDQVARVGAGDESEGVVEQLAALTRQGCRDKVFAAAPFNRPLPLDPQGVSRAASLIVARWTAFAKRG